MANKTRLRTMQYEVEAEQFAADMLLPDQLDPDLEGRTVQEIAAYYGVTENLIEAKWGK
jgi:Zn-dependent peptidase ImmA (M78 family)